MGISGLFLYLVRHKCIFYLLKKKIVRICFKAVFAGYLQGLAKTAYRSLSDSGVLLLAGYIQIPIYCCLQITFRFRYSAAYRSLSDSGILLLAGYIQIPANCCLQLTFRFRYYFSLPDFLFLNFFQTTINTPATPRYTHIRSRK